MGIGLRCTLGFSIAYGNAFAEQLERHGGALQRHHREAAHDFDLGLEALHDAVDAALAGVEPGPAIDRGLALLAACNDHLSSAAAALVRTRAELLERAAIDPEDPLLDRERFFASLDYDEARRELAGAGDAPCWGDLAATLCRGGARGGLRLLDRYHRNLQTQVQAFSATVRRALELRGRDLAESLHGTTLEVAGLVAGFARLALTLTYLSVLCERASRAWESSRSVAAAAS